MIELSDKVGETTNDLKQKAVQVLPGLYYVCCHCLQRKETRCRDNRSLELQVLVAVEKAWSKTHGENSKRSCQRLLQDGNRIFADDYGQMRCRTTVC